MKPIHIPLLVLILLSIFSCKDEKLAIIPETLETAEATQKENEIACLAKMTEHLNAVSQRDLATLKSTLSPLGDMLLILPQTETIVGVDAFMEYHKQWFEAPDWTIETNIVDHKVGEDLGFAIVEFMYRESDRGGTPYFNRMVISYDLQQLEGKWYVIKDHATSVEKSTDEKE